MRRYKYGIEPSPRPEPPSAARLSAAVSRIRRAHAQLASRLPAIFGPDTADALRQRVDALRIEQPAIIASRPSRRRPPIAEDLTGRTERLHVLVLWMAAVAEAIELESAGAAKLRADLDVIRQECEFIVAGATIIEREAA